MIAQVMTVTQAVVRFRLGIEPAILLCGVLSVSRQSIWKGPFGMFEPLVGISRHCRPRSLVTPGDLTSRLGASSALWWRNTAADILSSL